MRKRPKLFDRFSAGPASRQALVKGPEARRIIVSPDDVFQEGQVDRRGISLEGVVVRYMAVSAAIIGALVLCGLAWVLLAR